VHLLQEDRARDALRIVRDIRARYDGRKRNPFDEAECGHHYVRALASWGLIPAFTGFYYSALDGTFAVNRASRRVRWPWAAGHAWGTVEIIPRRRGDRVVLRLGHGRLRLVRLALNHGGQITLPRPKTLAAGRPHTFDLPPPA
jgi:hypothetical protein